ncbi:MAG: hypothetical protein AB7F31_00275 [Parachlamydiales bacterium]
MRGILLLLLLTTQGWTPSRQTQVIGCAEAVYESLVSSYPSYHYPFLAIKTERLKEQKQETILLFSYGSLINLKSAQQTLSEEALESRQPAIAFGVRRLFDYDPTKTALGPPKDPKYRAMLNLEKTKEPSDLVNGVVLEVPRENLADLCEREVGYDLVPVVYTLWEGALALEPGRCPPFGVAYAFMAPEAERGGRVRVNRKIKPRPDYYKLVREGAAEYGPDYLQLFIKTTYKGNGKPVNDRALLKRAGL